MKPFTMIGKWNNITICAAGMELSNHHSIKHGNNCRESFWRTYLFTWIILSNEQTSMILILSLSIISFCLSMNNFTSGNEKYGFQSTSSVVLLFVVS